MIMRKIAIYLIGILSLVSCVGSDDTTLPSIRVPFFSEDFNQLAVGNIDLNDWSNVSTIGGDILWQVKSYGGDKYAQISIFGASQNSMDVWLISPNISLLQKQNPTLKFAYKAAYYNGQTLSVLVSNNYSGEATAQAIQNATWTDVTAVLPDYLTSGYPSVFSISPDIDLSGFGENVHIAFRYQATQNGATTTYQVDNINVFEKK